MSSMVRASCPISAAPPVGIEVEKSPWPEAHGGVGQRRTGPATRSPSSTPAITASAASTSAVTQQLAHQVSASARRSPLVGSRASMSAMASPLEANTGKLDGVQLLRVDALHGEAPVGQRLRSAAT